MQALGSNGSASWPADRVRGGVPRPIRFTRAICGDLGQADSFYRGSIGLDPTRRRNGASFLSSGRYHHHLAVNVWQSAGAGRRDEAATGLAWFSLEIDKPDMFAAQQERLRQAGAQVAALANGIETVDPWGTKVWLIKI